MANKRSALKQTRISEKRKKRNSSAISEIKTRSKKLIRLTQENKDKAQSDKLLSIAISKIDKAVNKGILHKNTARRKRSRLMRLANSGS